METEKNTSINNHMQQINLFNRNINIISLGHGLQEEDGFWSIVCLSSILFLLFGAVYITKLWRPDQKRIPSNLKYLEGDYIGLIGSGVHHYPPEITIELCGCSSQRPSHFRLPEEPCRCDQNSESYAKSTSSKLKKPALSREIRKLQLFLTGSKRQFSQKCRNYKKLKPFRSRKESSQLKTKLLPTRTESDCSDAPM